MQISLEKLQILSEAELRRQVLIPLLRAMGFQDVTELHGSNERGKDIVMWKRDDFRARINYAVVAKAKQVTTGRESTDVVRQIRECLGSPYADPISLQESTVSRVIVVTSKSFTTQGKESIESELRSSGVRDAADFIHGEKLMQLIASFMPSALIWDSLQKASRELNRLSANYDFVVKVGPGDTSSVLVKARDKNSPLREPIEGSFSAIFPDTAEGMKKRLEFQKWREDGSPVTLSPENIANFEIPRLVQSLAEDGEIAFVTLAPSPLSDIMLMRLIVEDESGAALFLLDYVHFTHKQGGSKTRTLDNRDQPIPFRVELGFDLESKTETISCSFDATTKTNVAHYLRWLQFTRAVSSGKRLVLQDWNSGLPFCAAWTSSFDLNAPSNEDLALAEKLVFVQANTGTLMSLGEDSGISAEDAANTHLAWTIIREGIAELKGAGVTIGVEDESCWKDQVGRNIAVPLDWEFSLVILGTTVKLGTANVLCRGVLLRCDSNGEEQYTIKATEADPFVATFPQWLAKKRTREAGADARAAKCD